MRLDKVAEGIVKYMNAEIFPAMNDWQEVAARLAIGRFLANTSKIETVLAQNTYVKTFGLIDEKGEIDIAPTLDEVQEIVRQKGKVEIVLPVFGTYRFEAEDVEKLKKYICGGG